MGHIDPTTYDRWYRTPFGAFCHRMESDALLSLTEFSTGERVLDAGCGTGVYLTELKDMGLTLFGLDDDLDMLSFARDKKGCHSRHLILGSMECMPLKDETFDKVLAVCSLEFVKEPALALGEITRVLRTGGELLLGFLNRQSSWARSRQAKANDPSSIWHSAHFYVLEDLAVLANRCGLKLGQYKGAVHFPYDYRDKDISELEAAEIRGRSDAPGEAAFISASFKKDTHNRHQQS